MSLRSKAHRIIRSLLLGQRTVFDLPMHSPQTEIAVWLYGVGEPRDVTECHSVACPIPFMFCVASEVDSAAQAFGQEASLRFVERAGAGRVLGVIEMCHERVLFTHGPQLHLYRATDCRNFCISPLRRWTRAVYLAGKRWGERRSARLQPSSLDDRCNEVAFICPRPVVLVSLSHGDEGNIFPMNLMGPASGEYFVFALNSNNQAPRMIERGLLAISTVPFEQAEQVRLLGGHHRLTSIRWSEIPFATNRSATLGIPVPEFALTVRELQVEQSTPLGSHTFFVARIVDRQVHLDRPEFHRIHGLYAACRRKTQSR